MAFHLLMKIAFCLCPITVTFALAPANPFGWQETQPDGSPVGQLFLRGRPDHYVYTVDQHQHPVVQDENGWFVYASRNKTMSSDNNERRLLYPTRHVVTPDSRPPRYLQQEAVTANVFPDTRLPPNEADFSCAGQPHSLWCPNNPRPNILARSKQSKPKTIGTTRAIVVLVRFSDHADREMPSRDDMDYLFNGRGNHSTLAPTGTLQEFFKLQSFGQYTVVGDVQDWITAPHSEEYYSFGKFGLTSLFAKCAYGALEKMDEAGVDWSQYDQDGDGVLDSVVIFHSGYVAEGGGRDCNNNKTHGNHRIWSHCTSVLDNRDAWRSNDGSVRIGLYTTVSAVRGTCGSDIQRIGILGHEMLHMLALPDLLGHPGTGVGIWDVMGQCWGADGSLLYPSTMGSWCRQFVGWLEPTRITKSGEYKLGTSQLYQEAYRIDVGFPEGEYLLIENRQKLFHDSVLPGRGGLLIWHIDENNSTKWMTTPGWPSQEGWPGNANHYQIALLSPDGKYHSEKGKNYGDKNDCWTNGTSLKPGPGRQIADAENEGHLYPNTDSYRGGIIQRTGIRIYSISENAEIMSFRVMIPESASGVGEPSLAPVVLEPTEPPSSPLVTSLPTIEPTMTPTLKAATFAPSRSPTTTSPTTIGTNPPLPSATESPTDTHFSTPQPSSMSPKGPSMTPSDSPLYFPTAVLNGDSNVKTSTGRGNINRTTLISAVVLTLSLFINNMI